MLHCVCGGQRIADLQRLVFSYLVGSSGSVASPFTHSAIFQHLLLSFNMNFLSDFEYFQCAALPRLHVCDVSIQISFMLIISYGFSWIVERLLKLILATRLMRYTLWVLIASVRLTISFFKWPLLKLDVYNFDKHLVVNFIFFCD